jgi:hypothetical protein
MKSMTMRSRLMLMIASCILCCLFSCSSTAAVKSVQPWTPIWREPGSARGRPLFGVIRWDIFSGGDHFTNPELKSLSPLQYHDRVPYFLTIDADGEVSGNENDQAIIDRQIDLARAGGSRGPYPRRV